MEKENVTLETLLNISPERRDVLREKITNCFLNWDKNETVVDIMYKCREICINAQEDMFVCYIIGGVQSNAIERKQHEIVKDFFKHLFK